MSSNDCANPQDEEMDFNRNDDIMQAGIADLTACFDDELIHRMANRCGEQSKVAIEAGSIVLDGLNDDDNEPFKSAAAHAKTPKGVTAEQLSKVWRVSNEVAQQTLEVTTQLNKQHADSNHLC